MEEFALIMRHEDGGKVISPGTTAAMDEANDGLDWWYRGPKQIREWHRFTIRGW